METTIMRRFHNDQREQALALLGEQLEQGKPNWRLINEIVLAREATLRIEAGVIDLPIKTFVPDA